MHAASHNCSGLNMSTVAPPHALRLRTLRVLELLLGSCLAAGAKRRDAILSSLGFEPSGGNALKGDRMSCTRGGCHVGRNLFPAIGNYAAGLGRSRSGKEE